MRLHSPFVRLPIRVDAAALSAEVADLAAGAWRPHPEGAPGNTAVPLVAAHGDPEDDRTKGPMLPTAHLATLPYTGEVLRSLGAVVGRTRLMRIEQEGELTAHVDTNYYWRDHLRVHVPVVTSPDVQFACADESVHMAPGEAWVFDTWRPHRVVNPSRSPRVHLVVDTVGSASLWDLIDNPEAPVRRVEPGVTTEPLVTERVNHALVMTPWEFEGALALLLDELAEAEPQLADALDAALLPVQHSWRAAWATFGDAPDGWDTFATLRQQADALLARIAGDARLPNGVHVCEAVRQHVLRPALEPDQGTAPPTPRAFRPTLAGPAAPAAPAAVESAATIDRPVFVVSSPRSGSTLLFETLARARDLFTIGGESHRVIESITGLHPRDREWSSNRLEAADATPDTAARLRRAFAEQLRDRDGDVATGGAVRLLEKTPKNSLRVPFLAAAFPDARFVYLYRDPRETVSSMLDAWRSGRFVTYPDLPGWGEPPWSLLLVPGWRDLVHRPPAEIVTSQWAAATSLLLDDLEALDPDQWCVTSYDRILADPQAEMQRLCEFCDVEWDLELDGDLPLSRHTLDSPNPDKWRRNADELEPHWERVREVAERAHSVFAAPPRIRPVRPLTPRPPTTEAPDRAEVDATSFRSVHTQGFGEVLAAANASLLVTTYQSGRLIVVRTADGTLNTHFRLLQSPMGIAHRGADLAVGTKAEVLRFQNQPAVGARLDPPGRHDAVFMPRSAHVTGDIRIHDLAFAGDELWAVNTRFSCLVTFDDEHSFVPRWRPPFVTALSADDRCHLNGIAVVDDEPRYVTALGTSDVGGGWREDKATGGVVLEVPSGEVVASGLCMPHSPRWHDGRLWVLESGRGALGVVDLDRGTIEEVAVVPGFARGLGFAGPYAFVGLSQVREHVFEGIPLTADGVERACGVWVVDTRSGDTVAFLRFEGVVQELFEVAVLPGIRFPEITEPRAELADTAFVLPDAAMGELAPAAPE